MLLTQREIDIPTPKSETSLLRFFGQFVYEQLEEDEIPVRFVVTQSNSGTYNCELGILRGISNSSLPEPRSIFEFVPRTIENTGKFNAMMIVPTGIGAELGGHAGDAAPAARLLAEACDMLFTHPNVVNGSDINEIPDNALYIEGSVICALLMGVIGLQKVRSNRVLVIMDDHPDEQISHFTVNGVSASRAAFGLDCPSVVKLYPPIKVKARYSSSGSATGSVEGLDRLYDILNHYHSQFDAVALTSVIDVPSGVTQEYFRSSGEIVNPWGGVEAMLTHAISLLFNVPSAHAPMVESIEILNWPTGIVDPRMAAEAISTCFLHSVLKGLHRSPRIVTDKMVFTHPGVLTAADVSCLVIPDGCVGLPTLAALEQGIPVIAVRENRNRMKNDLEKLPFTQGKLFIVENYLEAVGVMTALKTGVTPSAVRRPLADTKVTCECLKPSKSEHSSIDDASIVIEK